MNIYSDSEALHRALSDLQVESKRDRACGAVKEHIEAALKELSLESFTLFEEEMFDCIAEFSKSKQLQVKHGALAAIWTLISCPISSPELQATKLHRIVCDMLANNTDYTLLEATAECLGGLARNPPISQSDMLEEDMSLAIANLTSKHSNRRIAGCSVLNSLAINAPAVFFMNTTQFLKVIWGPLKDSKEAIRICAVRCISSCLAACSRRKQNEKVHLVVYQEVLAGLRHGSFESVMSSFLVADELMKHTGSFMVPRYKEFCDAVFELKSHKNKRVRMSVIEIIPRIAEHSSSIFVRTYLDDAIELLLNNTKVAELKSASLLSIGQLCRSMGGHLTYRIDDLVEALSEILISKNQKKLRGVPSEALKCISDMVCGLGVSFHYRVLGLLDAMLEAGLTEDLIEALSVITSNMPMHKEVVHRRLLAEIVKVLEDMLFDKGSLNSSGTSGSSGTSSTPMAAKPNKRRWYHKKDHAMDRGRGSETSSAKKGQRPRKGFALSSAQGNLNMSSSSIALPTTFPRGNGAQSVCKQDYQFFSYRQQLYTQRTVWESVKWGHLADDIDAIPCPSQYPLDLLLLSLRTLRILSVSDHVSLLVLVHRTVLPFLYADNETIREEAAKTAAALTKPAARQCNLQGCTAKAVEHVLVRLVEMCVTDPVTALRIKVLKAIDQMFHHHLHQMNHVSQIMFLTTDKSLNVRNLAIEILSKLSNKNPALVLPHLRQVLQKVICDLDSGATNRIKEGAALTTSVLLRSIFLRETCAPFLGTLIFSLPIDTFNLHSSASKVPSDLHAYSSKFVLVTTLSLNHDPKNCNLDTAVVIAGMKALGELCHMFRQAVLPYAGRLVPVIIGHILDRSSVKKQEIAVKTLGRLVSATGLVVIPYLQFPQLLPALLDLLGKGISSAPWSLRREILRTIGLIGALDPNIYESIVNVNGQQSARADERRSQHKGGGEKDITIMERTTEYENFLGESSVRHSKASYGGNMPVLFSRDCKKEDANKSDSTELYSSESCRFDVVDSIHSELLVRAAISVNRVDIDVPAHAVLYELSVMRAQSSPVEVERPKLTPSSSEYYPRVAIDGLMKILLDPTLGVHHPSVTQAIMYILQVLGMQCMLFLEDVVPFFLEIVRKCGLGLRESLLNQLSQLCGIAQYHLGPYVKGIFEVVKMFWDEHTDLVLNLVESLACYVPNECIKHSAGLLPLLLAGLKGPPKSSHRRAEAAIPRTSSPNVAAHNVASAGLIASDSENAHMQKKAKPCLRVLERVLRSLRVLLPLLLSNVEQLTVAVCSLIDDLHHSEESATAHTSTVSLAVRVLTFILSQDKSGSKYPHVLGRAVHTVVSTMKKTFHNGSFSTGIVQTTVLSDCALFFTHMALELESSYLVFHRMTAATLRECDVSNTNYLAVINAIRQNDFNALEDLRKSIYSDEYELECDGKLSPLSKSVDRTASLGSSQPLLSTDCENNFQWIQSHGFNNLASISHSMKENQLKKAWDVSEFHSAAEWMNWFKRFLIDLIRESPSPFLRACASIAQAHFPLARQLFQAAFVSCWKELSRQSQNSLIASLQVALHADKFPSEILLQFLNLAEFMEHDVNALPIEPHVLAGLAEKSLAFAKALHYRELEFQISPPSCFESLINIYKKLNLYDGAMGVQRKVQKMHEYKEQGRLREDILMSLEKWNEALQVYQKKLEVAPFNKAALINKIKCLTSLGRWEESLEILTQRADLLELSPQKQDPLDPSSEVWFSNDQAPAFSRESSGSSCSPVKQISESRASKMFHAPSRKPEASRNFTANEELLCKTAEIGARAAWSLHRWDMMDSFVQLIPSENNVSVTFMKAVLSTHHGDFDASEVFIDQTRMLLDGKITALLAESYTRAYNSLILTQQLSELEEIIDYKKLVRKAAESRRPSFLHPQGSGSSQDSELLFAGLGLSPSERRRKHAAHFAGDAYDLGSVQGLTSYLDSARAHFGLELSNVNEEGSDMELSGDSSVLNEEVATHKELLIDKWKKRIRGIPKSGRAAIPYFLKILNLRRMVDEAKEDIDTFKDFATLCRHNGNWELSQRSLGLISGCDVDINAAPSLSSSAKQSDEVTKANIRVKPPGGFREKFAFMNADSIMNECRVSLEKLRLLWNLGCQEEATSTLSELMGVIGDYHGRSANDAKVLEHVYVQSILKFADWKIRLLGPGSTVPPETRAEVLKLYSQATVISPHKYQAWHQWAMSNYNAIGDLASERESRNQNFVMGLRKSSSIPSERVNDYVLNALKGFARAMSLGVSHFIGSVMQDMLSLLQIWFKYSEYPGVGARLKEYLGEIPLDCWLGVLPQLIARIHHNGDVGRSLLHDLLSRLGTQHAQALMFPLSVALQSPREDRQRAARLLLMNLRQHSASLIDQSVLVSKELIRIAILWDEEWYSTLEDASRLYFGEGNIRKMLDLLLPLHEKLQDGTNTIHERAFLQSYGNELSEAYRCLEMYLAYMEEHHLEIPSTKSAGGKSASKEEQYLARAWDLYIPIFKRITPHLRQIVSHKMANVSPQLMEAEDLDLAIPGTYTLTGGAVRIKGFSKQFGVILSKQRPRKIRLYGDDGLEYVFLLKGHEDLRQDERAMQLFGLVNALLERDHRNIDHDLSIQRYAVVPLSPNAGLVGWVPKCDTLHDLIRTYRQSKNTMLDVEQMLMQQLCPFNIFEHLTPMQKLEVFEHALNNTSGQDLHKILWYHSASSECWITRRDIYTKSLAVMSVVGYVLGLGDRHPSNLMLQRNTCKILHIDFGDCFEVAMHRNKFPEKIPFRLTRMLVMAMEVSGVEGTFRNTCQRVMKILREHRFSIVAILEAFLHDPLLSWRLLHNDRDKANRGPEATVPRAHKPDNTVPAKVSSGTISFRADGRDKDSSTLPAGETQHDGDVPPPPPAIQRDCSAFDLTVTASYSDEQEVPSPYSTPKNSLMKRFHQENGFGQTSPPRRARSNSEGQVQQQQSPPRGGTSEQVRDESLDVTCHGDTSHDRHMDAHKRIKDLAESCVASGTSSLLMELKIRPVGELSVSTVDSGGVSDSSEASHVSQLDSAPSPSASQHPVQRELNDRAVSVVQRVLDKLTGLDFQDTYSSSGNKPLDVSEQIDRLIIQATSNENLSTCYMGWCPLW